MVLVEVNIGEHVLDYRVDDVTRLEQVVDALARLTRDDGLLSVRLPAVHLLRDGLVDADGQNHLARHVAGLHLLHQPGVFLKRSLFQLFRFQVVQRERYLLVFVVLIVVVDAEVGFLLCSHHAPHQFHGRVVLAAVSATLRLDGNFRQLLVVGFQLDVLLRLGLRRDGYDTRLIAHGTEGDVPSLFTGYLVLAVDV